MKIVVMLLALNFNSWRFLLCS